ncbi:sulfite exporter TauE/SafE family protein [Haliscomenobacter hydrossis]|uniref:Probable membrane transporter protein n=1 Tax=Haliscomenobacter hydrossis (strain ATCC 27775 / DSM 1100 / LMG 10767 / O) TaxID=760192 RepID=F4L3X9_HALH1|nr:sulfite exporter TauE/SafE family protein [Haliscomenobacter hydrossis]AEE49696.1 protein of unknown function DUF81 [Haliscomenobacter hydrossis DSM 1100]
MLEKITLRHISVVILSLKIAMAAWLAWGIWQHTIGHASPKLDVSFFGYLLAGFVAQLVDGALGMAYGVSCTTLLLHLGIPPALATASVHTAEVFTTGASGLSHLYLGNVDKKLFLRLIVPGVIGAVVGAYLISEVFDGKVIKPYIAAYLLFLGIIILLKSFQTRVPTEKVRYVSLLGVTGGFLDAVGGGGWGPIVTSNIVNQGNDPRKTVGTVNTAEFFVAFFSTGVFLFFVGVESWQVVAGLIAGGILAAPFGAWLVHKISAKALMFLVGLIIILTQSYTLVNWWIK